MKTILKISLMAMASVALMANASSCDNNGGDTPDDLDPRKKATIANYVDDIVVSTYRSLADEAVKLSTACEAFKEDLTQEKVQAACDQWKTARVYWELSEAFLFGAASDDAIDPHIDSWPLQKSQLDQILANTSYINGLKNNGYAFDPDSPSLDDGLLGFHTIEYMIFRNGSARLINGNTDPSDSYNTYGAFSDAEITYCIAVAKDIRNQCILLEASWAGLSNITSDKRQMLAAAKLAPDKNYGQELITAGEEGNKTYKTQIKAYVQMLDGAATITDEVGSTKITDPVTTKNVLDVESWYSWNSIKDYADNIRGVRNAYYGTLDGTIHANSLCTYIASLDQKLDADIKAGIKKAVDEIEAIPYPFRNHLTEEDTDAAVAACSALFSLLESAMELID